MDWCGCRQHVGVSCFGTYSRSCDFVASARGIWVTNSIFPVARLRRKCGAVKLWPETRFTKRLFGMAFYACLYSRPIILALSPRVCVARDTSVYESNWCAMTAARLFGLDMWLAGLGHF